MTRWWKRLVCWVRGHRSQQGYELTQSGLDSLMSEAVEFIVLDRYERCGRCGQRLAEKAD